MLVSGRNGVDGFSVLRGVLVLISGGGHGVDGLIVFRGGVGFRGESGIFNVQ
jgi:hypothetical protein